MSQNIQEDEHMAESIQKLPVVIARVGKSRSSLLQLVKDGKFPKPIRLSDTGRSVGFIASEVDAWIAGRVAARDAA